MILGDAVCRSDKQCIYRIKAFLVICAIITTPLHALDSFTIGDMNDNLISIFTGTMCVSLPPPPEMKKKDAVSYL